MTDRQDARLSGQLSVPCKDAVAHGKNRLTTWGSKGLRLLYQTRNFVSLTMYLVPAAQLPFAEVELRNSPITARPASEPIGDCLGKSAGAGLTGMVDDRRGQQSQVRGDQADVSGSVGG